MNLIGKMQKDLRIRLNIRKFKEFIKLIKVKDNVALRLKF